MFHFESNCFLRQLQQKKLLKTALRMEELKRELEELEILRAELEDELAVGTEEIDKQVGGDIIGKELEVAAVLPEDYLSSRSYQSEGGEETPGEAAHNIE
eukprot:TRINITY_DN3082_c0_g1_i10.p1 TRINITY_DN3082_c0_g1~~TRINITY_DN3082_c0_g1_i10.p1  ORF type:complete len:100 (-),score=31.82 TRINITY_DN3082_c0_g1_i10:68-367(-)